MWNIFKKKEAPKKEAHQPKKYNIVDSIIVSNNRHPQIVTSIKSCNDFGLLASFEANSNRVVIKQSYSADDKIFNTVACYYDHSVSVINYREVYL